MRPSRLQHIKLTRTFNLITRMDQAKIPENQFIKVSGVFNTKKGMVAMRDFGSQVIHEKITT